ncbi:hypothetical protein VTJ83DRAFT_3340 [Remersonia thermophila]|uniref:J domain-containing protein n=1 Tax=Remersonia thermophila TaxID=72144 RepID=A0ABR4DDV4_9PEZI
MILWLACVLAEEQRPCRHFKVATSRRQRRLLGAGGRSPGTPHQRRVHPIYRAYPLLDFLLLPHTPSPLAVIAAQQPPTQTTAHFYHCIPSPPCAAGRKSPAGLSFHYHTRLVAVSTVNVDHCCLPAGRRLDDADADNDGYLPLLHPRNPPPSSTPHDRFILNTSPPGAGTRREPASTNHSSHQTTMTSTLPPDPWKALGVERTADKAEIRSAYKKLVLKCHPDKIQDPALKALKASEFQKVQQAYELLNDDVERTKYEQKLRLAEMQRAKAQEVKTTPNISVPRSSSKYSTATYDVPSPERPKHKSSSSSEKLHAYYAATPKRSQEEIITSIRITPVYEEPGEKPEKPEKTARRTASYEKSSRRDEERREERRRRKEEEELEREKEKEREREKEKERKAEKKRLEKERERERDKDRRRASEDKRRPYLEEYHDKFEKVIQEDEKYVTGKSEKKKSPSKKHDETRERERDRERRDRDKSSSHRAKSPHVGTEKHEEIFESVKDYIAKSGSSLPTTSVPLYWTQSPKDRDPPAVPTPPPVDLEDDVPRHVSSRHRRASNEAARSREKLKEYDGADASPKARPIPNLSRAYTAAPTIPESPPRSSRTQPDVYTIPSLSRNQTWGPGMTSDYEFDFELDEEHDRRRHRGSHSHSRRHRSPSGHRYKSSSKLDPTLYPYGESPTSRRSYTVPTEGLNPYSRSPTSYRDAHGFRVKVSKDYTEGDVVYSRYEEPLYYHPEGYVGAA